MSIRLPIVSDTVEPETPPVESWPTILMPQAIHARLSSVCNLSCAFCERESWKNNEKPAERDMTPEVWRSLVEKFIPGVIGVELCGLGEPTLARLFPTACQDILRLGKQLYFPTNGHFLGTKHVLDAVGDTPRVSISVDAGNAESYAGIRPGGNWDKLTQAVKTFRAEKPNAFLHSQFTAGAYNIDELPTFMRWAAEVGIQEVIMRPVQAHTVAREDVSLRFHRERAAKATIEASQIAQDAGIWFISAVGGADDFELADESPASKLQRYLSIVPFDTLPCEINTNTGPVITDTATVSGFDSGAKFPTLSNTGMESTKSPRDPGQHAVYCSAAMIVAGDGDIWTCFAGHSIGNSLTDDYMGVVMTPKYQAFLHGRTDPTPMKKDHWCANCSRTF